MGKLKNNQKGFGAVEVLLIIIILILIGFVGWFIYHTDHKSNASVTSSSSSTKTTPVKSTSKPISYFSISQWGVRAPYSGNLSLEYAVTTSSGEAYAKFSSTQLDATSPQCKSAGDYGGIITRYASTDTVYTSDGYDTGQTAAQYFTASNTNVVYTQVGNYYYQFSQPQGVCDTAQASQDAQQATVTAVKSLVNNLQATPSQ